MLSTRALGLAPSLRQAAFLPARNQALRLAITKRTVQTQSLKPSDADKILNKQRLKRPSSPHFTIYQPQLTWIASIFHRVAGSGLSVLLYGFSLAYLVAPGTFDSTHVIEYIAGLPEAVKIAGKAILAVPFTFHSFNGVRHLVWDANKFMNVKGAYTTGYAVLAATGLTSVYLTFFQ